MRKEVKKKLIWASLLIVFYVLLIYPIGPLVHKHILSAITPGYVSKSIGMTDLHWAAWEGRKGAVERFLTEGADIDSRDENGDCRNRW